MECCASPCGRFKHMSRRKWTPREDRVLLALVASLGSRWSQIRMAFPNRSVASTRNRWLRIEKGYMRRCVFCVQSKCGHVCFEQIRQGAEELDAMLPDVESFGFEMF